MIKDTSIIKNGVKAVIAILTLIFAFTVLGLSYNIAVATDIVGIDGIMEGTGIQPVRVPTVKDDFKEDRVIVTLKQRYSKINGEVKIEDFKIDAEKAGLTEVTDLVRIDDPKNNKLVNKKEFVQILSVGLRQKGKEKVLEAVAALAKSEIVFSADPDYNFGIVSNVAPQDPFYIGETVGGTTYQQWGLTGDFGIKAPSAWNITHGSTDIRVGIMDSGIDGDHDDLSGRVLPGNFSPAAGIDVSHGTVIAGIIGGIHDTQGIAGIAQASMVPLRFEPGNFVDSVTYAMNNNIPIINASFYYRVTVDDPTPALAYMPHANIIHNYQGLLVCSAGNGVSNVGQNTDSRPEYPACYSDYTIEATPGQPERLITNVISVGAINSEGERSAFSNFGANSVQIYAPGENIVSTCPADMCDTGTHGSGHVLDGYHTKSGTSFAAPHVAGVAALLLSKIPGLHGYDLKQMILNNTTTEGGLELLNAYACLSEIQDNLYTVNSLYYEQTAVSILANSYEDVYLDFGSSYQLDYLAALNVFGSANISMELFDAMYPSYNSITYSGGYAVFYPQDYGIYRVRLNNSGNATESAKFSIIGRTHSMGNYTWPPAVYDQGSYHFGGWYSPDAASRALYFYPETSGEYIFHFKPDASVTNTPQAYLSDTSSSAAAVTLSGGECFTVNLTAGKEYFVAYNVKMVNVFQSAGVTFTVKKADGALSNPGTVTAASGTEPSYYMLSFATAGVKNIAVQNLTRRGYVKLFTNSQYTDCYNVTDNTLSLSINASIGAKYVLCVWPTDDLTGSPVGYVDTVSGGAGTVTLVGWAFDYDDVFSSVVIHVYIGGSTGGSAAEGHNIGAASVARPDVNAAFGIYGMHGYNYTITTAKRGWQRVYIYAIDIGYPGYNPLIGYGDAYIS